MRTGHLGRRLVEGGVKQNLYLKRGRRNGERKLKWMLASSVQVPRKGKGGMEGLSPA